MDKTIRILHVVQRMEAGGTQALLMNLYRNIDRSKIQFDFLVEYPEKQFYDDEIKRMGGKIYYTTVRKDYNIFKFKRELKEILKNNSYKIMHVHVSSIGNFCFKIAKTFNIKVRIAHAHNNGSVHDIKYLPRLFLRKLFSINATDFFACSNEAGEYFFKGKKYKVLKNAIDSSKFIYNKIQDDTIKKELNLEEKFIVGHIGRLHQQKNHIFLLKIFKEIKNKKENAKLLLVGTGPLESEIKNKVKELSLEKDVLFLGNRNDVNKIYQSMDVFIFPSLFEGLGIVAIEAQASGTPVLCSDQVSSEVEISAICKKMSLDKNAKDWAEEAISLSKSKNVKKNMQNAIIDAGFDIKDVAQKLQKYYLEKIYGENE